MESEVKAAVATTCLFVATVATFRFAVQIYRRWRHRDGSASRRCCSDLEEKPQNRFKRVLAGNSYTPFKHFKREGEEKGIFLKMHPFKEEISYLLEHPPMLIKFSNNHPTPVLGSSYLWINTEQQLESLIETLGKEKVFAVDTEQHNLRSFLGFTALMQISTEKEDFLLDTIALHDVMGILRPIFADPSICKVFHGADNDVIWLQRDFHIYVVNMFDTAKACEVLSKPQKSLAFLLETYCGVLTDKSLQREDWRQRPLSEEMIQYALTDAHYLLHIAECLASELREERLDTSACPNDKFNFFFEASRRSNTVCLQLYVKEIELSPGASAAASILSRNWNKEGLSTWNSTEIKDLIWKVCAWRDLLIVKTYFGGREVLPEDLETALLVGMSPNEQRRLEKKRGLAFRHNKGCDPQGYSSSLVGTAAEDKLDNIKYSLQESLEDNDIRKVNTELRYTYSPVIHALSSVDEQTSTGSSRKIDEIKPLGIDVFVSSRKNENGIPEQEMAGSSQNCKSSQDYSSRRSNRLSLLGHGHHSKEVVERLLKEQGEDGILQFCQKWREVFVEAIDPRFLPPGWDIMHSGRRDFGEYSVYNLAKKMQQKA